MHPLQHEKTIKIKAICLLSGGLDSSLALKIMLQQQIDILALHFVTLFCRCDGNSGCSSASIIADTLNVPIKTISLNKSIIPIIKKPKYGYGKNMNPCIDCRINMLKHTKKIMEEEGASFVFTGEVLGQRPMSQHLKALKLIEKEAGLEGLILRPLSAHFLPLTIPEKKGWILRKKLLAIKGRSRKEQIFLANLFKIKDYPCPAGGCLLAEPAFSRRLKDLLKHNPDFDLNDARLLKYGRHFRIDPIAKLIVGRNEQENNTILSLKKRNDIVLQVKDYPGPISLLRTSIKPCSDSQYIKISAEITARYADIPQDSIAVVEISSYTSMNFAKVISVHKTTSSIYKDLMIT